LVAFEMPITRLDGKSKLNQNRSAADRAGVIAALAAQADSGAQGIARLMEARQAPSQAGIKEAD
jgi:transcriptional regulator